MKTLFHFALLYSKDLLHCTLEPSDPASAECVSNKEVGGTQVQEDTYVGVVLIIQGPYCLDRKLLSGTRSKDLMNVFN